MTEKRFKKISVCGDWGIKDVQNDKVLFFATTDEVNDTFEVLNELNDENKSLKQQLKSEHQRLDNAILLERTRMGQNALKQYKEAIQWK